MRTAVDILLAHRPKGASCEQIAASLTAGGSPCSRQAVENWFSGRRNLSLFWYGRLTKLFEVPAEEVGKGRDAIVAHLEEHPAPDQPAAVA